MKGRFVTRLTKRLGADDLGRGTGRNLGHPTNLGDVVIGECARHKPRLEGTRWQAYATVQHGVEEGVEGRHVLGLGIGEGTNRGVGEEEREQVSTLLQSA